MADWLSAAPNPWPSASRCLDRVVVNVESVSGRSQRPVVVAAVLLFAASLARRFLAFEHFSNDHWDAYLKREYESMAEIPVEGADDVSILVDRSRSPLRIEPDTAGAVFASALQQRTRRARG